MNDRGMNAILPRAALAAVAALAPACGADESAPRGSLEVPAPRQAQISLTPALDVSDLYDASLADRFVVDEIIVHIADVRMLGADPRIPAGGLGLLPEGRLVSAFDGDEVGIELPFPRYLLSQDDLAVYIRLDRSPEIEDASVVVRGRLFARPAAGGINPLTADPDPDGDPADSPESSAPPRDGYEGEVVKKEGKPTIDPDGDPARECDPDPDGDPARESRCRIGGDRHGLVLRGMEQESVPIELRGYDVADLIAGLDTSSSLDVIIGIPAARWLTPETVAALDRALPVEPAGTPDGRRARATAIVVNAAKVTEQRTQTSRARVGEDGDEYFLSDDLDLSRLKVRR